MKQAVKTIVDSIEKEIIDNILINSEKSEVGVEKEIELGKFTYDIMLDDSWNIIEEEQIKELAKGNAKVKTMFPEVFETKLEIGKWKKTPVNGLYCPKEKSEDGFLCYGFTPDMEFLELNVPLEIIKEDIPATDSEVLEALTNEAKKRGFKDGVYFNIANGETKVHIDKNSRYTFLPYGNKVLMNNWCIFENGKWAVIIKTYTKEEAEKLLNAKII